MAAKTLASRFPTLALRPFRDLQDAYEKLRDIFKSVTQFFRAATEAINDHAALLDIIPSEKSWSFKSPTGASGTFYWGGYYDFASSDNDFSPSTTHGTANAATGAHFFVVLGAATVDILTLTVTGTSITTGGVRTTSDTENIVIPNSTAVDSYFETTKIWIGQLTISVASGTAKTCNFGLVKSWDNHSMDFTVAGFEATWLGGATDTGADIKIRHHKTTGWTFNGGAEPTPPTEIGSMATDYSTEDNVIN